MSLQLTEYSELIAYLQEQVTLEGALEELVRVLDIELPCQCLGVFLKNDESEDFRCLTGRRLSHSWCENTRFSEDSPFWDDLSGKRLLVFGPGEGFALEKQFSQLLVTPVFYQEEVYGFIFIDRREGQFSDNDRDTLMQLGSLASIITALHYSRNRAQDSVLYDDLTGLLNYRGFMAKGDIVSTQMLRYGHSLCLLLVKLPEVSRLVEQHKQQMVKAELVFMAELLRLGLRTSDLVALINADTFAMLLPETSKNNALNAALRLEKSFSGIKRPGMLSTAWAITVQNHSVAKLDDMIKHAQKRFYYDPDQFGSLDKPAEE